MPENLVSRDGFSRPVPRQPAHLHTQAESGAYVRDSSRVPRRRPIIKPPYANESVRSLSGHAIAYRWRPLPRVRRYRASKPQGSSERVLPWQVTMDQLIYASLSHTDSWYEVGMLKIPYGGNFSAVGVFFFFGVLLIIGTLWHGVLRSPYFVIAACCCTNLSVHVQECNTCRMQNFESVDVLSRRIRGSSVS